MVPFRWGLNKPVQYSRCETAERDIVNMSCRNAVIDAIVEENIQKEQPRLESLRK